MNIIYSSHALKRMGQRGVTYLHVEQVLMQPACVKKSFEGRKEAEGVVENRHITIVFAETENYIKVITVI